MKTSSEHGPAPAIAISIFLAVAGIWIPFLHLYLLNVANLSLPFSAHLPHLGILSIALVVAGFAIQIISPLRFRALTSCLLLSLGIFLWAEGTLFIGDFGFFQGGDIDWDKNRYLFYLELLLVLFLAVLTFRFKRRFVRNAVLIASLLTVSSLINLYPPFKANLSRTKTSIHHTFNEEGIFQLSPTRNVLLFIIDTLQSDVFAEIVADNPQWRDALDGFTYFPDATSAFPKTYASVPNILTGTAFDNSQPFPLYLRDAYLGNSAPKVLKKHGFDVRYRAFTLQPYFAHPDVADNLSVIGSSVGLQWMQRHEFIRLCNLALFRLAPFPAKPWVYSDDEFLITESSIPRATTETPYLLSKKERVFSKRNNVKDLEILDQMLAFLSADGDKPTFRVFHFRGVHTPIVLDGELNFLGRQSLTRDTFRAQAEGMLKLLSLVFDRLRQMDAYDNSLIFVVGDHGAGDYASVGLREEAIQDLGQDVDFSTLREATEAKPLQGGIPTILVKRIEAEGTMAVSRSPVELGDVPNTIFSELGYAGAATGPSMFAVPEFSERIRYHRYYYFAGWGHDYIIPLTEYGISGFSWDQASWSLSGRDMNRRAVDSHEGEFIVLGQGGNLDDFVHEGWSAPSVQGRRLSGGAASVVIPVEKKSGALGLKIRLNSYRSPSMPVPMSAYVNDQFVANWTISKQAPDRLLALVPEGLYEDGSDLHIRLETGDSTSAGPLIIEIRIDPKQEIHFYSPGDTISFSLDGNSADYLGDGWASPDQWGAWTLGHRARLYLVLDSVPGRDLEVEANFRPAVYKKPGPLFVDVIANGETVTHWSFPRGEWQTQTFRVPGSLIGKSQILDLSFSVRNPRPPRADKWHGDIRKVGLGFKHLIVREAGAAE